MKISIFGLGYVGCVGMGCLAELGHDVIGVDIDENKINLINKGVATVVENKIDTLINRNNHLGRIKATRDGRCAVLGTDAAILCVGTPNEDNGHLNMQYIYNVATEIGHALIEKTGFYTIAIRSTVMPGVNNQVCRIIEKVSGKINLKDFAVVSNPEFLREGSAVEDFNNPPYTVLASESARGINVMKKIYEGIKSDTIITDVGTAEMIKLVNNSYHALKICFANEIGRICKSLHIDSHSLMKLFVSDQHLNISPLYFKPGFAYGGSCLPKDLKALNSLAHDNYITAPIINSIEISNHHHIEYALDTIIKKGRKNIGIYGITFKQGTDDLRFSPILEVAERLIGKGYDLKIYDKNVVLSCLMGKNKSYIYKKLPHINKLLKKDFKDFIAKLEVLVISNYDQELESFLQNNGHELEIIDLVRAFTSHNGGKYEGICW